MESSSSPSSVVPTRFESFFPKVSEKPQEENEDLLDPKLAHEMLDLTNKYYYSTVSLVLHQFEPAWAIQAYAQFAKIKLHVQNARYPSFEATGPLPQLSDGNFLVGKPDIIPHLQTHHTDLDQHLSSAEKAESYAFATTLTTSLELVLLYSQYLDPTYYAEVTRPTLAKLIPFPLNQTLITRRLAEVKATCRCNGMTSLEQVYVTARAGYAALNAKLGARALFFNADPNATPCSLDARVFGHVLSALAHPGLCHVLLLHGPALLPHAQRLATLYFPDTGTTEGRRREDTTNTTNLWTTLRAVEEVAHITPSPGQTLPDTWISEPYQVLSARNVYAWGRTTNPKKTAETSRERAMTLKGARMLMAGGTAMVLYCLSFLSLEMLEDHDLEDED